MAFVTKDLLTFASAAFFRSGVERLVFSGTLSLAYTFLVALVSPHAKRSANNADLFTSFLLAFQTLLTAGLGEEEDRQTSS